ncbi:hypothetical protein MHM84_01820 [Halomonas sp. McH1-25]|uniref:hypothetical protein n=1 Tax=unclassified Halomonas TaxID=2609666 RepID=UPI001EF70C98|nr:MULTISPECIES: hypothetical protein [unclassified Halomonas]MCG7598521.1 hypothetical protein [Halomonas sp. McH1-25]MCP1341773.1 hypothetical protein [Halomonas sp. FL8]MCP1360990.1 hypothetical protein [Halomonas sp. BBD45]MCP1364210.1 hypothetical protein [Halomonas sp. BBD48]
MSHISLTFEGVDDAEKINQLTTALMMVDGVESAEVGRHGADVEGRVSREALMAAVAKLGVKVR